MSRTHSAIAETEFGGAVEPGFEPVREAFIANFERGLEVGASCAVYIDGVKVVDLWGGTADAAGDRPWSADTIAPVNSVTKGVTAVCLALLVERQLLDPSLPVRSYWPEFSAAGKSNVTVRQLLSHRAGLPVLDGTVEFEEALESPHLAARLAAQKPIWEPGTTHGYHAFTFGALADALLRRITGRSVGRFLVDEITRPLELDVFIGLPETEFSRLASLVDPVPQTRAEVAHAFSDPGERAAVLALFDELSDPMSLSARAGTLNGAISGRRSGRSKRFYAAEIPAANGVTNARALAQLYASCVSTVDGYRLLSDATLDTVTQEQATGSDTVLHFPTRFAVGFQLDLPNMPMLGPNSFGHPGAGGALGFADREFNVGFGYVQNQQAGFGPELRTSSLTQALRQSLK